jgi:thiamine kinase-like enzyme
MDDASLSPGPDARQGHAQDLGRIVQSLTDSLGHMDAAPTPLGGGITNRNYRATFAGRDYVIRVPGKDTQLLGIDRDAEVEANRVAAELGIAPPVAASLDDPRCIVTEFIEGREMEAADLADPDRVADVADALRAMHSAPAIPAHFDSFRIVEDYARIAVARGAGFTSAYTDALATANRIEDALSGSEHEPVPCHNDLLAANFINDGRSVRIVDWEYAGMGDRYFDLANFAVNNELSERARLDFLELYFQNRPTSRQAATLHLFSFMSDFREAMWGVVQTVASDIEFDFEGYADKHFARLSATAAGGGLEAALEAARGD